MQKLDSKSEKYFKVSRAILEILEHKGPEAINHTALARLSQVSRPWIYEYMGKNQDDLINIAAEVFASFFSKESFPKNIKTAEEFFNHIKAGQEYALSIIKNEPIIIRLYFRYRGTETPIGVCIDRYEENWLQHISGLFTSILKTEKKAALIAARIILSMRLGLYHQVATSKKEKVLVIENEILSIIHDRYF